MKGTGNIVEVVAGAAGAVVVTDAHSQNVCPVGAIENRRLLNAVNQVRSREPNSTALNTFRRSADLQQIQEDEIEYQKAITEWEELVVPSETQGSPGDGQEYVWPRWQNSID